MTATAGPTSPPRIPALTAGEIAVLAGGTLTGDSTRVVRGVAPLIRATSDQLSFLSDKRYAALLSETQAGVVLVSPELASVDGSDCVRVIVQNPLDALLAILPKLYPVPPRPVGVDPTAIIGEGVVIGSGVAIQAFAVVGDGARIGDGAWIGPHCVVSPGVSIGMASRLIDHVSCASGTLIGDRVVVHAGVRLGGDGFGYVQSDDMHRKFPHVGRCIIEDDVEIGSNTCIDRGSIDDTVIGAGTKIDNLVHIAHNVRIGRACLLMAHVAIAGSTRVGDGCILAGQVGVAGHVTIGDGATLGGRAGVIGNVPAGVTWSGFPARPHKETMRASGALMRLTSIIKQLERLVDKKE